VVIFIGCLHLVIVRDISTMTDDMTGVALKLGKIHLGVPPIWGQGQVLMAVESGLQDVSFPTLHILCWGLLLLTCDYRGPEQQVAQACLILDSPCQTSGKFRQACWEEAVQLWGVSQLSRQRPCP
jgi:hypothetical protein